MEHITDTDVLQRIKGDAIKQCKENMPSFDKIVEVYEE